MNKDQKRDVYSEASVQGATVIPMSAVFPLVTAEAAAAESGSIFYKIVKANLVDRCNGKASLCTQVVKNMSLVFHRISFEEGRSNYLQNEACEVETIQTYPE